MSEDNSSEEDKNVKNQFIYTLNLDYSDFVELNCTISKNTCSFLIDTQPDISLIKLSSLKNNIRINTSEIINIRGITDKVIKSLGVVYTDIFLDNCTIEHKFHVITDNINIPCEGIIGKDFIKSNKCKIDYGNNTISFYVDDDKIVLDLLQGPDCDVLVIPARSEVIRKITLNNVQEAQVIEYQQIDENVFIARCIVDHTNPYVRILNTSDEVKTIKSVKLQNDNLSNYHVYTINQAVNSMERSDTLLNVIQNSTPQEFQNDIKQLCKNHTDIFSLETDEMSINNFYSQKLRLNDNTPVFVNNYRLPQSQKDEIDEQVSKLIKNNLIEESQSP